MVVAFVVGEKAFDVVGCGGVEGVDFSQPKQVVELMKRAEVLCGLLQQLLGFFVVFAIDAHMRQGV